MAAPWEFKLCQLMLQLPFGSLPVGDHPRRRAVALSPFKVIQFLDFDLGYISEKGMRFPSF